VQVWQWACVWHLYRCQWMSWPVQVWQWVCDTCTGVGGWADKCRCDSERVTRVQVSVDELTSAGVTVSVWHLYRCRWMSWPMQVWRWVCDTCTGVSGWADQCRCERADSQCCRPWQRWQWTSDVLHVATRQLQHLYHYRYYDAYIKVVFWRRVNKFC